MPRRPALLAALCAAGAAGQGFTAATAEAGISFRHVNAAFLLPGGAESRHMPEAMGAGVLALWGFDGAGRPDVVAANDTMRNFLFRTGAAAASRSLARRPGWGWTRRTT